MLIQSYLGTTNIHLDQFDIVYIVYHKIEKNETGGACGTYGGRESCAQGFGGETWGKETTGETTT